MQAAPLSEHESARLTLLNSLNILDSGPESHFDRITALAARLLGTPISLVSLVDHDRQWFKSRHGLAAVETPREVAFCAHAIQSPGDTFIVPDATLDLRFHDNPLVTGAPHVRFYAGAPLTSVDGLALGTLCIIDTAPRQLSPEDEALLRDLAAVVSRELGHRELALRGQGDLLFQCQVRGHDDTATRRLNFVSEPLARLLGTTPQALNDDVGVFFDQVLPIDLPALRAAWSDVGASREPLQSIGLRLRLRQPGRHAPLWLQMRAEPRRLPGGAMQWSGSFIDVSLEHEVETQQRDTDRLRTTTALVGGVAHDFNNILGAMTGLAELSRDLVEPGTRLHRNLGHIHTAGLKAASLIRQMLDYARQSPLEMRPARLAPLVAHLLPLLDATLPAGTRVAVETDGADTDVLIDAAQIEQVVHNLVRNAGDAMQPDGGVVRITVVQAVAATSPLRVGSIRLTVGDTGCGIAASELHRIFDPFFTTKAVGAGTGLGLSSAQGIVVAHGGTIEVESTPGAGSSFSVWLPAHVPAPGPTTQPVLPAPAGVSRPAEPLPAPARQLPATEPG